MLCRRKPTKGDSAKTKEPTARWKIAGLEWLLRAIFKRQSQVVFFFLFLYEIDFLEDFKHFKRLWGGLGTSLVQSKDEDLLSPLPNTSKLPKSSWAAADGLERRSQGFATPSALISRRASHLGGSGALERKREETRGLAVVVWRLKRCPSRI